MVTEEEVQKVIDRSLKEVNELLEESKVNYQQLTWAQRKAAVKQIFKERTFKGESLQVEIVQGEAKTKFSAKEVDNNEIAYCWSTLDIVWLETVFRNNLSNTAGLSAEVVELLTKGPRLTDLLKYGLIGVIQVATKVVVVLAAFNLASCLDEQKRRHTVNNNPVRIWEGEKGFVDYYYWHDQEVPKKWLSKPATEFTNKEIEEGINWPSMDQRAAFIEIAGWDNIFRVLDAKELQRDDFGVLYSAQLPDTDRIIRLVKVRCPTQRDFVLRVPEECETAHAAVTLCCMGTLDVTNYAPEVRG